jgi:hypothetical protein
MITNPINQKESAISRYAGWETFSLNSLGSLRLDFPPPSPYLAEVRQMKGNGLR